LCTIHKAKQIAIYTHLQQNLQLSQALSLRRAGHQTKACLPTHNTSAALNYFLQSFKLQSPKHQNDVPALCCNAAQFLHLKHHTPTAVTIFAQPALASFNACKVAAPTSAPAHHFCRTRTQFIQAAPWKQYKSLSCDPKGPTSRTASMQTHQTKAAYRYHNAKWNSC